MLKIIHTFVKNNNMLNHNSHLEISKYPVGVAVGRFQVDELHGGHIAMLKAEKISPENLALGMGGKLLQADINRDTNNFATKACYAVLDGIERNVVKSPTEMDADGNITKSFKKSKQGKLKLVKTANGYRTVTSLEPDYDVCIDEMVEVFRMGEILVDHKFEDIRERARVKPTHKLN
jgi:hypothetical protein